MTAKWYSQQAHFRAKLTSVCMHINLLFLCRFLRACKAFGRRSLDSAAFGLLEILLRFVAWVTQSSSMLTDSCNSASVARPHS